MWRQYIRYFPANGSTNPDVFNLKGNHPSKFQLAGVRRFGGVREHPNRHTHKLTHSLTDWRFYRVISCIRFNESNRSTCAHNMIKYKCTCIGFRYNWFYSSRGTQPLPPYKERETISLYQSTSLSVSKWVCVCVCLFPTSSETANPSKLKFWGMIFLGIGKVLG